MNQTKTSDRVSDVVELVLEDIEQVSGGYPVSPPPGSNGGGG